LRFHSLLSSSLPENQIPYMKDAQAAVCASGAGSVSLLVQTRAWSQDCTQSGETL
jgi:Tfp pilus assembly protein PilV